MTTHSSQKYLEEARRLLFSGAVSGMIQCLENAESQATGDHAIQQQIAELYLQCGQYRQARRCYERSVALQADNPAYLYNLAASMTSFGELDEAEELYSRVIGLDPEDWGAWLNRSGLRTQTPGNNHVGQLEQLRTQLDTNDPGHVPLCYTLAKELEDLGRYEESFASLQEGSHRKRLAMQYDISGDESAMAAIARHFDAALFRGQDDVQDTGRPVFILGLPRSGTTLVERIIGSHSEVGSLGEHNMLPFVLMDQLGLPPEQPLDRLDLIARSAALDFSETGQRYMNAVEGFGNPAPRLIDKTPLNFLYLGLIRLSMPGARIIHMRRNPLDACYAIYKTLFRAAYPFSYSLQELGRYYIAYRKLMDHWRTVLPGSFLDVDYESVVRDPEGETRRILDYLGLEWEDGCRDFHLRDGVAATASAAQVRQPVYSSSVGLWRKYQRQLAPFAARLSEHGIDLE